MDYEKLKSMAETITLPDEMKRRIVRNCKTQLSDSGKEIVMKTNRNNPFTRKSAALFVTVVLCLSMSMVALAATGVFPGFFRDITNWQGTVVGTSFEQAGNEIEMDVTLNDDALTVAVTFVEPQTAPYIYAERLGIARYRIVDGSGNAVKEGTVESAEVVDGHATIHIQLDDIDSGSYTLIVSAFVSEKKADRPLNISGNWECTFTK